ncbi:MAG: hypothetical protein ACYCYR_05730 [Desulfobulbaceae bacterium]|jgi:hypothetical protein
MSPGRLLLDNSSGGRLAHRTANKKMNILRKIFGIKNPPTPKESTLGDPQDLLKEATSLKKSGDIEGAILKLKSSYKAIERTGFNWDVKPFIRLPQYLQLAGKKDEAWKEFNNLLLGYPTQLDNLEVLPMTHSIIYDKMRLFLQKEKKFKKAVLFAMFSYLCWTKGLYLQKRKKELNDCISDENIDSVLESHLNKAKLLDTLDVYKKILKEEIQHLPNIDLGRVDRKFKEANNAVHLTP